MFPTPDGRRLDRRAHGGDVAADTGEEAGGTIARGSVRRVHPGHVSHPASLRRRRVKRTEGHEPARGDVEAARAARHGAEGFRASRGCEAVQGAAFVREAPAFVVRATLHRRRDEFVENLRIRVPVGVLRVLVQGFVVADKCRPAIPGDRGHHPRDRLRQPQLCRAQRAMGGSGSPGRASRPERRRTEGGVARGGQRGGGSWGGGADLLRR
mmetsp:Transcript_4473/g.20316  ORF Transcript_4473/g.20316 Transcript_4473/m.20316 type:complete len:211 (+) Transcript_4473:623-1255(+)